MDEPDDIEDTFAQAARWIARRGRAGWTDSDEAAFATWRAADPTHQEAFHEALALYRDAGDAVLEIPNPVRQRWSLRVVALPAAVLVAILVGYRTWFVPIARQPVTEPAVQVYTSAAGQTSEVVLPDGSSATLDADTRLVWKPAAAERRLTLDHGRALFHVRHDATQPFIIEAGIGQIHDLGTVFSVDLRPATVVVRVAEGSVRVQQYVNDGGVALLTADVVAGQQATLGRTIQLVRFADEFAAWQNGRAVFHDLPLGVAASEIERYVGHRIVFDDQALRSLRLSGSFDWRESGPLLAAIAIALPVQIRQEADGAYHVAARPAP